MENAPGFFDVQPEMVVFDSRNCGNGDPTSCLWTFVALNIIGLPYGYRYSYPAVRVISDRSGEWCEALHEITEPL